MIINSKHKTRAKQQKKQPAEVAYIYYWLRTKDGQLLVGTRGDWNRVSWAVMYPNGTHGCVNDSDVVSKVPIKNFSNREMTKVDMLLQEINYLRRQFNDVIEDLQVRFEKVWQKERNQSRSNK